MDLTWCPAHFISIFLERVFLSATDQARFLPFAERRPAAAVGRSARAQWTQVTPTKKTRSVSMDAIRKNDGQKPCISFGLGSLI